MISDRVDVEVFGKFHGPANEERAEKELTQFRWESLVKTFREKELMGAPREW
jgi:hypothetical protein